MPPFDKGVSIINTQLSIIPNFEQLQTNVDLNNIRQLQSSVIIFNVDLHNVEPRGNKVVNMTIKKWKKQTSSQEHNNTFEFQ